MSNLYSHKILISVTNKIFFVWNNMIACSSIFTYQMRVNFMEIYLIKHIFAHICSVNVHLITVIPMCKLQFNHFKSR